VLPLLLPFDIVLRELKLPELGDAALAAALAAAAAICCCSS
jgi:hypothetical protein